jgi:hypothetical protein
MPALGDAAGGIRFHQGLGRRFKRATRRHVGVYDWPAKNSWRSGSGRKLGQIFP